MIEEGKTIVVNPWKNFGIRKMTCVKVFFDAKMNDFQYEFDNGMKLYGIELQANFDLWNSRNGYAII